ncbi:hypothetical protein PG988_011389 [Apiospora saccharicola]
MAALANHQRLARVSRISQLGTLAIPPGPAAAAAASSSPSSSSSSSSSPSAAAAATTYAATAPDGPGNITFPCSASSPDANAPPPSSLLPHPHDNGDDDGDDDDGSDGHGDGHGDGGAREDDDRGDDEDQHEHEPEQEQDDGFFWSPPTSPLEEPQEPQYYHQHQHHRVVATDLRISLLGPDPALRAADSDEFKRQAREIKKDLQRLSRYTRTRTSTRARARTRRQHSNPATLAEYSRLQQRLVASPPSAASAFFHSPDPPHPQSPPPPPLELELEALQQEHEFRRRFSIQEGRDFLEDFLRVHFGAHRDHVSIRADADRAAARGLTLEEIKMIGNEEDVAAGVRQCRRLFNAPVLSDRVGSLLYEELRQGDELDHSHEWRRFVTDSDSEDGEYHRLSNDEGSWEYAARKDHHKNKKKKERWAKKNRKQLPPEELRRRRVDEFERSKAEFLEMRQMASAAAAAQNNGNNNVCKCSLLGGPRAGQATSMFGCVVCSPPPPGAGLPCPSTT